jgi:excisionase family DNA binding protein
MTRAALKHENHVSMDRLAYSPSETAKLIGVGRTTLYELIGNGSLETVKLGSRRLITRDAIDRLLAANKVVP